MRRALLAQDVPLSANIGKYRFLDFKQAGVVYLALVYPACCERGRLGQKTKRQKEIQGSNGSDPANRGIIDKKEQKY